MSLSLWKIYKTSVTFLSMFVTTEHCVFTCKTFFVMSKLQIIFSRIINFSTFEAISSLLYESKYSSLLRIRFWRSSLMFSTLKFRFLKSWRFSNDSIISAMSIINRIDLWINKIVNNKTTFFSNSSSTIFNFFNFFSIIFFISFKTLFTRIKNRSINFTSKKSLFFLFWQLSNSSCK